MKLIEAMKFVKDQQKKMEDLRTKIGTHCANLSYETPVYENQGDVIHGWLQSHHDIALDVEKVMLRIQKTNIETLVTIELGGNSITKPIAAWILRRRVFANLEMKAWGNLTDRGLKEGVIPTSTPGAAPVEATIRRYYNPLERDNNRELYRSEPSIIDGTLEIINAITDLLEL